MTAPAYVLLGMGIGFLVGYSATDEHIPEPTPRPAVVEKVMAQEISKPEDKTCLLTNLSGRDQGIRFTVALPAGSQCHTLFWGQQND